MPQAEANSADPVHQQQDEDHGRSSFSAISTVFLHPSAEIERETDIQSTSRGLFYGMAKRRDINIRSIRIP